MGDVMMTMSHFLKSIYSLYYYVNYIANGVGAGVIKKTWMKSSRNKFNSDKSKILIINIFLYFTSIVIIQSYIN